MKEEALKYASIGLSVIPLGKISLDSKGNKKILYPISWKKYQDKIASFDEINSWRNFSNLGVVTGTVSGIMVLDTDTYKNGFDSELLHSFNLPITPVQQTARGGKQYFFKHPEGIFIKNAVCIGSESSGIDIRGDGGMVIIAPTKTTYGEYSWIISPFEVPFADVPPKLLEIVKANSESVSVKKPITKLVGLVEGQGRNSAMASLIGKLINTVPQKKWDDEVYSVAKQVNQTYKPPLSDKEFNTIYESITKIDIKKKENEVKIDLLYVIDRNKNKVFSKNTENMCRILREHPNFKGRFRYDSFKNSLEILPTKTNIWRLMEDNDAVNIQTIISVLFSQFRTVGKDMVYDAMIKVAKENTFDSASDFITSLKWDEKPRLDEWLTFTFGTPSDVYHRAVASNWIKGLVKRIIEPGCKFDYVLVLEGSQGTKKSTSLSILGKDWHVETTMSTDSKDFFMQFQGKAIIEFSEGETLSRTEVKRMKAIITMQKDKYRPPYERISQDFPRRCVFAMTTNQTEYLKDETGNRRWLPVTVVLPEANVDWLEENRDQILAEAYYRVFVLKEKIYEFPKEETLAAQQLRKIHDPYEDSIAHWYYNILKRHEREAGITVFQVYQQVYRGGMTYGAQMNKSEEMTIASTLKDKMGLEKRQIMINMVRTVRWFNPNPEVNKTELEMVEDTLKYMEN